MTFPRALAALTVALVAALITACGPTVPPPTVCHITRPGGTCR